MEDRRDNQEHPPQQPARPEDNAQPLYPAQQPNLSPSGVPPYGAYPPPFPSTSNPVPPFQGAYPAYPPPNGPPSGQYYPGGPPPTYGYQASIPPSGPGQYHGFMPVPPPQFMPVPPPKKGLKVWHWVVIGIGGTLMLCCVGSIIIAALASNSSTNQQAATTSNTQHIEQVPTATQAPIFPTDTPSIPGSGNHMELGTNYTESAGSFVIVQSKDTFGANDKLAYVITLDQPIGVTQAQFLIVHVDTQGFEDTVLSQNIPISDPQDTELANQISIGSILTYYGQNAGSYRLEISDGHTIVAQADFTYTGSSAST